MGSWGCHDIHFTCCSLSPPEEHVLGVHGDLHVLSTRLLHNVVFQTLVAPSSESLGTSSAVFCKSNIKSGLSVHHYSITVELENSQFITFNNLIWKTRKKNVKIKIPKWQIFKFLFLLSHRLTKCCKKNFHWMSKMHLLKLISSIGGLSILRHIRGTSSSFWGSWK